jgi:ketosteroid isomerase-like protein
VAEADIRKRVEDWAKALRAKNIDAVMSLSAPLIRSRSAPARYAWQTTSGEPGKNSSLSILAPITYEVRELNVTTQGELAFVHSINRVSGTLASGHSSDMWVRWSFGLFHALFKSRASR